MKKINYGIFILMNVLLILLMTNCKCHRDDSTPSPDPCYGKSATGAMFNINENPTASYGGPYFPDWIKYSTDTVTNGMRDIDFVALDTTGLSYTWTIGSTIYNTKKVTLDFSSRPVGQNNITITLNIKKKSPNSCFPSDTGVKTLTKLLVISDTSIVSGNFRGIQTDTLGKNPSDSFTVYLNPIDSLIEYDGSHHALDTIKTLVIKNLNQGCTTNYKYNSLAVGYKEIEFYDPVGPNCGQLEGKAILTPTNNNIIIYYSYLNAQSKPQYAIFKGKRVK